MRAKLFVAVELLSLTVRVNLRGTRQLKTSVIPLTEKLIACFVMSER